MTPATRRWPRASTSHCFNPTDTYAASGERTWRSQEPAGIKLSLSHATDEPGARYGVGVPAVGVAARLGTFPAR